MNTARSADGTTIAYTAEGPRPRRRRRHAAGPRGQGPGHRPVLTGSFAADRQKG